MRLPDDLARHIQSLPSPGPAGPKETRTTWAPVDLSEILAGTYTQPTPTMLERTDGRALLYPGRIHALNAEPEAGKSWLALKAADERLMCGDTVLYVDFEDSAPSIVSRLRSLGASTDTIAAGFIYLRPDESLTAEAEADFESALARNPSLVVFDGLTEAYVQLGLNPEFNPDVAKWMALLPRRALRRCPEAAVLLVDHVVKNIETRGRWAIGGQHKLAGVDVAFSVAVVEPFGRGQTGTAHIKIEKDRPGGIREFASSGDFVAHVVATSSPTGDMGIRLEPPQAQTGPIRPKALMQRVSIVVEKTPGLSKKGLRSAVSAKGEDVDYALELLLLNGYIEFDVGARGAHLHRSTKPYREKDD